MTAVRQAPGAKNGAAKAPQKETKATAAKKPPTRKARRGGPVTAESQVAQVRLQADELRELYKVMQQLGLSTKSEALREGIRLLAREAAEIAAAENIQRFYGAVPAPLPAGVIPVTEEELAAAEAEQW